MNENKLSSFILLSAEAVPFITFRLYTLKTSDIDLTSSKLSKVVWKAAAEELCPRESHRPAQG